MRVLQIGVSLAAVYLVLVALAWLFQRRLIYLPMDHRVPPAAKVLRGAEDVVLATKDGLQLGAWWVPTRVDPPVGTWPSVRRCLTISSMRERMPPFPVSPMR